MNLKNAAIPLLILLFAAVAGCVSRFDAGNVRNRHTADFSAEIEERAAMVLPPDRPLGLSDCIQIAIKNLAQRFQKGCCLPALRVREKH